MESNQSMDDRLVDCLHDLKGLRDLKSLFGRVLGYDVTDAELSTWDWPESITNTIKDIRIIATMEEFKIIYCEMGKLYKTEERRIISKITRDHQFILVIFTDSKNWHFVNMKFDLEAKKPTRLFRRIVIERDVAPGRTIIDRFMLLALEKRLSFFEVQRKHDEAFDVEAVTRQFFKQYREILYRLRDELHDQLPSGSKDDAFISAQQFLNRLMFLFFIKRMGWLNEDRNFFQTLFGWYGRPVSDNCFDFYENWMKALFFHAFNGKRLYRYKFGGKYDLPDDVVDRFNNMPYLNGGLFEENEIDRLGYRPNDRTVHEIVDGFLERYNFTISEDTPLDVEVAVDHEMLGKVYESLIAEEERGKAGIFYTPRVEVDFMCRRPMIEYLTDKTSVEKETLVKFVMNAGGLDEPPELQRPQLKEMEQALGDLKVVDPACGSGAFLVGMMNVIVALHKELYAQLGEPLDDSRGDLFALKKRIIADTLYGVDVKKWAIRVGELRLWLSLTVGASRGMYEMSTRENIPMLPNLNFKIRRGDSLVEEIAGYPISVRGHSGLSPSFKDKLDSLIKKKRVFCYNVEGRRPIADPEQYRERILKEEAELFCDLIGHREAKKDLIRQKYRAQETIDGTTADLPAARRRERDTKLRAIDEEIEALKESSERIKKREEKKFLWELDFAEVFGGKGGFDIVIGNPPYVRQEIIAPPDKNPDDYATSQWNALKRDYKEKLLKSVRAQWGDQWKIQKKADLYVYFYMHGLALLRPGGTFSFITSNSWLDVGYGAALQEFLLRRIDILEIWDNQAKRSFAEAAVNTIIAIFRKPEEDTEPKLMETPVKFVALKQPFEDSITAENILAIMRTAGKRTSVKDFRLINITQKELLMEGMEVEREKAQARVDSEIPGKYAGNKWGGKYLRAPDIYWTIIERAGDKLVRVGDIAEVRRGFTTGANDFFYVEDVTDRVVDG